MGFAQQPVLNESGKWSPDAIERALGHRDSNSIRGTYHRGTHWMNGSTCPNGGAIIWIDCAPNLRWLVDNTPSPPVLGET